MIACAIGMTGPPPSPCRMRIATRNSSDGAIPDRNELVVKITVQIRKNRRRPNRAESQPVAGMMIALAARNDVMTQDISSMPAESEPCMWGRATLVTLESRTCMTVTIITENVIAHRRAEEICPSVAGSTELTSPHYVITAPARVDDWSARSEPLARLLLPLRRAYAGLTAPDQPRPAGRLYFEEDRGCLPLGWWVCWPLAWRCWQSDRCPPPRRPSSRCGSTRRWASRLRELTTGT